MLKKFLFFFLLFPLSGNSANDSLSFFKAAGAPDAKRIKLVITSETALAAGTLIGLNELWYEDFPRSPFHFFNDNKEWLLMDKAGHLTTSYYVGRTGIMLMEWSGYRSQKAVFIGGTLGLAFLSGVEVLDGFSAGWGFSGGDMAANGLGAAVLISQELLWKEQRISIRFSFSSSPYAKYRPDQLGSSFSERMLKDYNGQLYWLSANIYSFLNSQSRFPKWLNASIGYGAEGMTGARTNREFDKQGNRILFSRYRQFYLAPDIDLSKVFVKPGFLHSFSKTIGFLKFPLPAVEFSVKGIRFRPVMF